MKKPYLQVVKSESDDPADSEPDPLDIRARFRRAELRVVDESSVHSEINLSKLFNENRAQAFLYAAGNAAIGLGEWHRKPEHDYSPSSVRRRGAALLVALTVSAIGIDWLSDHHFASSNTVTEQPAVSAEQVQLSSSDNEVD